VIMYSNNENRYLLGKVPRVKERLASLAMISAKTESHCLMSDIGTKSNGDDLAGREDIFRRLIPLFWRSS